MSHITKVPNLRTLFELRKINQEREFIACGRFFIHDDKYGLVDETAVLWPIEITDKKYKKRLNSCDIVTFQCHFNSPNLKKSVLKYLDHAFGLNVNNVLHVVENKEEWKNAIIPSPIPLGTFLSTKKNSKKNTGHNITYFFGHSNNRFNLLKLRNQGIERTRKFFSNKGFFHAETPSLVPSGGMESYLNCFVTSYTDHRGKNWRLQLPTSPEFALKKIVAEGFSKVFQIARSFRNNGELSKLHEPEFIMVEWYRAAASLEDVLTDVKKLVLTLAEHLGSSLEIPKNWPVFKVEQLFKDHLNIDLNHVQDTKKFFQAAKNISHSIFEHDTWDDIFCKLFMEKIEPFLKNQKACFVSHYPSQMCALAALDPKNKNFALRAEAYLYGVEISNGYFELVDNDEFTKRLKKIKESRGTHFFEDPVFESTIKFGLPQCAGNALGLDRVISILLEQESITQLQPIPFLSQFSPQSVAGE